MRQKVAKALAREAREFAEQNDRTTDVLSVHKHAPRFYLEQMEELNPNGTPKWRRVEIVPETLFLSDGPRAFKQILKRAYRKGLLVR